MLSRRAFLRWLGGLALAGSASGAYAGWVEPAWRLRVQRWALTPAGWPAGLRLRLAVLADIHIGPPWMTPDRLSRIVARTNNLGADIILLLGDYEAGHRFVQRKIPLAIVAQRLAGLNAPLGVWAVLGNHDWWHDATAQANRQFPPEMGRELHRAGIPILENRAVRLATPQGGFWLAGLGDQIAFPPRGGKGWAGVDDLPGTLAQITDEAPVILMAHEPDIFPRVPKRVALTLSGHTHGGQLRLFGWSPVVPSAFANRYAWGHVAEAGRHLIVSGGLGCSIIPVRLGVPPEITLVELGG
ncbi:MAG: metallophosphoesterase [Pseudomonadota bacterium]